MVNGYSDGRGARGGVDHGGRAMCGFTDGRGAWGGVDRIGGGGARTGRGVHVDKGFRARSIRLTGFRALCALHAPRTPEGTEGTQGVGWGVTHAVGADRACT